MLVDKSLNINIGISGISFQGEHGDILGNTSFGDLKDMVAGYSVSTPCTGFICPFCTSKPDICIPGFLEIVNNKPLFKLLVDRKRSILKRLVGTVIKLKNNPSHLLYITAFNIDQYNDHIINIKPSEFTTHKVKDGIVYLFQVTKYH